LVSRPDLFSCSALMRVAFEVRTRGSGVESDPSMLKTVMPPPPDASIRQSLRSAHASHLFAAPQKHLGDARRQVKATLSAQAAFWKALSEPLPDVSSLLMATTRMIRAITAAETAFDKLLQINSQVRRNGGG
jgi:hypothetical protein